MQMVILCLIVFSVYLFIRFLAKVGAWMGGARYRAYRQLAARYHGRYETRGLSDTPTVSFTHKGSTVRVGLAPTIAGQPDQIPRTRVVARFGSGIPFRLELAPAARPAPPQPPKGTRHVKLGDPEFDRGFVVQANDLEMARDFLSPARPSGDRQLPSRRSFRGNAGLDQPRANARPDRPQPGRAAPRRLRGPSRSPGLPRRADGRSVAADQAGHRHRRPCPRPAPRTTARPSARSAASRSATARSSSARSAVRLTTAIAGNTLAPVRSTAATARSV